MELKIKTEKEEFHGRTCGIGCDVQETNLFAIQENFWTRDNKNVME